MINYFLKKIFISKEIKREKVIIINARIINENDHKFTLINFIIKADRVTDSFIGYIELDAYCYGNKLDMIEKFIGKKVILDFYVGRDKFIMNKRILKIINYHGKNYELSNDLSKK